LPRALSIILSLIFILTAGLAGALYFVSTQTVLTFDPAPTAIGASTPVSVRVTNPHGIRSFTATIEQNNASTTLATETKPANRLTFWRAHQSASLIHFKAGKDQAPALKEGKARLVFSTQSNDLRGAVTSITADLDVILRPPAVSADGFQHYINQGGSELATFTPAASDESGVRVGMETFRSFPLPGHPDQRFSLFAYSWDTPPDTPPIVYARNTAGTEATARFWFKVFPKKFRARDLDIDDKFLEKVDNQIDPGGSGDLVSRFLKINGDLRRQNNKTLADLRLKTADHFLWTQAFLQLANSQVESAFADRRSYIYKGKKIDEQVHLGFDLATTQHGPVVAANDGKVVWAAPLGIYGNCIVVDHGYGLQSIYGHLSELAVKEGEMVTRGETMGKSGSTGLAGGDHLHYSMQIDGVQVNPLEWWDDHWIMDHVRSRIQ
jgi:murein DD-endopeptidase MepM/ murein hydrolase activator NlpD